MPLHHLFFLGFALNAVGMVFTYLPILTNPIAPENLYWIGGAFCGIGVSVLSTAFYKLEAKKDSKIVTKKEQ